MATSLAPGFRFHPTDEELVRYYLRRKVANKPLRFDAISVIDIYKSEPWDLPAMSKLKTRDLEWYFFSALDKKYSNGSKTNRATEKGYWKTTGKDRPIQSNSRTVGMKKTLVYHQGRAPHGTRSNWVMHEYRLVDEELAKTRISQDAFVLCRIFQKSGTGPKNGEQYGAPFIEEEWDDDELIALPGEEMVVPDELVVGDEAYIETNDPEQNFDMAEDGAVPLNSYNFETNNNVEHLRNFGEYDLKPILGSGEKYGPDIPNKELLILPGLHEMEEKTLKDEFVEISSNKVNDDHFSNLLDNPFLDASDDPTVNEGFFLEANDLSNPVDPNSVGDLSGFDVDEYLNFFDATDMNMTFDPTQLLGFEDSVSDQEPEIQEDINGESMEVTTAKQRFLGHDNTEASSSKQKPSSIGLDSDVKYPFLKQASHMLGGIPAPPAFASEFPMKDASLRVNPAQPSSSIHVTAGMIRIENMSLEGNVMDWPLGKNTNVNIALPFGLLQGDISPTSSLPVTNLLAVKMGSVMAQCWFFLMFFWVLIFAVSYKIGSYICTK
ncbi:hypothetical protein K2173_004121 [Erythroxylum novogranatense]|uniref:NAC domain-containing protein n=1 Tax=Erythroxylum novogranatense TaxID=1862640 RepID=A0AAV8SYI6_9ROSI|nr:hypothetical protein K2173_004121 [Erythroxylum novogranatense]